MKKYITVIQLFSIWNVNVMFFGLFAVMFKLFQYTVHYLSIGMHNENWVCHVVFSLRSTCINLSYLLHKCQMQDAVIYLKGPHPIIYMQSLFGSLTNTTDKVRCK